MNLRRILHILQPTVFLMRKHNVKTPVQRVLNPANTGFLCWHTSCYFQLNLFNKLPRTHPCSDLIREKKTLNKKKVLAVASQGGHLIQLMRLKPVFDQHDTLYVSNQYREGMGERFIPIIDANRNQKIKLVKLLLQMGWILLRHRPDVVISSGAAPGYFALMFGKWLGAKTIWLDSIANAEELSLSGQQAGKFADMWLTQWPELALQNGPKYGGRVL